MNKTVVATIVIVVVLLLAGAVVFNQKPAEPVGLVGNPDIGMINPNAGTTTDATSTPSSSEKTFTMADVKAHNSKTSCYTTIRGNVYDVTSWIDQHPGGAQAILSLCGTDGTAAFTNQHGGQPRQEKELATFKIGVLVQ